jgi:hypothetical protein
MFYYSMRLRASSVAVGDLFISCGFSLRSIGEQQPHVTVEAPEEPGEWQGLTLVHFSAQCEPFCGLHTPTSHCLVSTFGCLGWVFN